MDEQHLKALSIFYPRVLESVDRVKNERLRFVQYTSAEAAMSILKNKKVWLRNVQCMNDYREVEHGIDCLVSAIRSENEGQRFKDILEEVHPGILKKFAELFDSWIPFLRTHTYITCVSEHPAGEDKFGRLSMWRAYGGDTPVAIVMNPEAFESDTDALEAYTHPVAYLDADDFCEEFGRLADRIEANKDYVKEMGPQEVINYLFETFKTFALCVKHPGFLEEREWRVVYNPALASSEHVENDIVSVNGVPQEIHQIPLRNIPDEGLENVEIPELINRIIIGPIEHQTVLGNTFIKLLQEAGCADAHQRVFYSGIPLRAE